MNRYIRLVCMLSDKSNFLKMVTDQGYSYNVNDKVKTTYLGKECIKNTISISVGNNEENRTVNISCYIPNYSFIEVDGYLVQGENFRHNLFRKMFEKNGGVICEFKNDKSFDVINLKSKHVLSLNEDIKFLNAMLEIGYPYDKAIHNFIFSDYDSKQKIFSEKNKRLAKINYYTIARL